MGDFNATTDEPSDQDSHLSRALLVDHGGGEDQKQTFNFWKPGLNDQACESITSSRALSIKKAKIEVPCR